MSLPKGLFFKMYLNWTLTLQKSIILKKYRFNVLAITFSGGLRARKISVYIRRIVSVIAFFGEVKRFSYFFRFGAVVRF